MKVGRIKPTRLALRLLQITVIFQLICSCGPTKKTDSNINQKIEQNTTNSDSTNNEQVSGLNDPEELAEKSLSNLTWFAVIAAILTIITVVFEDWFAKRKKRRYLKLLLQSGISVCGVFVIINTAQYSGYLNDKSSDKLQKFEETLGDFLNGSSSVTNAQENSESLFFQVNIDNSLKFINTSDSILVINQLRVTDLYKLNFLYTNGLKENGVESLFLGNIKIPARGFYEVPFNQIGKYISVKKEGFAFEVDFRIAKLDSYKDYEYKVISIVLDEYQGHITTSSILTSNGEVLDKDLDDCYPADSLGNPIFEDLKRVKELLIENLNNANGMPCNE